MSPQLFRGLSGFSFIDMAASSIGRTALVLFVLVALALTPGMAAADNAGGAAQRCETLRPPPVSGARLLSFQATLRTPDDQPAFCDVTVDLTHGNAGDRVRVQIWLPASTWNGRFQGTGGGGYGAGQFERALRPALASGYAAASTDAGHAMDVGGPPEWALDEDGWVNTALLVNFASRSVHDMTVLGKAVTARYYGRPAAYSYWNGCSGGGRQGLMEAQQYPDDYDGILAGAPAIGWPRLLMSMQWPQIVMREAATYLTPCEFEAVTAATVKACDADDGVADGVINEPARCEFDPRELVGTTIECDGEQQTLTETDAEVIRRIQRGPVSGDESLWPGLPLGASFATLAATTRLPSGEVIGAPFYLPDTWIRYFVTRNPDFDTSTMTHRDFIRLFQQSSDTFGPIIGTDNPNLNRFSRSGGKLLVWHGLADQLITATGSINYRRQVERVMGGAQQTDRFFRLFLAPGVDHCAGGAGPSPTDPLASLVDWVERGKAPDTIPAMTTNAAGETVTRNLCRYPQISTYDGVGDPTTASSYRCTRPTTPPS